jgi:hypothetical protein
MLRTVHASDDCVSPPKYPWPHRGPFSSYDHNAYVHAPSIHNSSQLMLDWVWLGLT